MAHFHLEVLLDLGDELRAQDPATLTPYQRGPLGDYRAVIDWLGVSPRAQIETDQHEQFARGFDAYFVEGKAPNAELRGVFARIRAWLFTVYKSVQPLHVHGRWLELHQHADVPVRVDVIAKRRPGERRPRDGQTLTGCPERA